MASYVDTFHRGPVTYTAGTDEGGATDDRWSAAVRTWVETGLSGRADLKTKCDAIKGAAHPDNADLLARHVQATLYDGGIGVIVAHYQVPDASSSDGTLWTAHLGYRVVDWPWAALGSQGCSVGSGGYVYGVLVTDRYMAKHPYRLAVPNLTISKRYRAPAASVAGDLAYSTAGQLVGGDLTAGVFGTFAAAEVAYAGGGGREAWTGAAVKGYLEQIWRWDYKGFAMAYYVAGVGWAVRAIPLAC